MSEDREASHTQRGHSQLLWMKGQKLSPMSPASSVLQQSCRGILQAAPLQLLSQTFQVPDLTSQLGRVPGSGLHLPRRRWKLRPPRDVTRGRRQSKQAWFLKQEQRQAAQGRVLGFPVFFFFLNIFEGLTKFVYWSTADLQRCLTAAQPSDSVVHIYTFSFISFSAVVDHGILTIVPWAVQ